MSCQKILQIAIIRLDEALGVRVRLSDWRKSKNMTQGDLADALGCSQPFVSLIERANDQQIPGRDWIRKIWVLTRGEVAPNDFYDLPLIDQLDLPMDEPAAVPLLDQVA